MRGMFGRIYLTAVFFEAPPMNARELRTKYIEFFRSKGHLLHESAPLVPIDVTGKLDETLLFTGAGMVQFKPYFRGIAVPPEPRLVTSQKCVRAVDIEEVGNPSHLTFFEMLGNFSFGDYFKKEAIEYAWEFLFSQEWLNLDKSKVCVTVFENDDEAYSLWEKLWSDAGYEPSKKIVRLGEDKNFWPAGALSSGPPGPCGPCSEIFFLTVAEDALTGDFRVDEEAGKWLEIWNLVFMQYEWRGRLRDPERPHMGWEKEGMDPLPQKNIDTGMGLDRTASVLGGFSSVYETDVFSPILQAICDEANAEGPTHWRKQWGGVERVAIDVDEDVYRAIRIIADHVRTACFCIADGILPSNSGRGYVLRRLIRRAVWMAQSKLGFVDSVVDAVGAFLPKLVKPVVNIFQESYPEIAQRAETIKRALELEENGFRSTLTQGYLEFHFDLQRVLRAAADKTQALNAPAFKDALDNANTFEKLGHLVDGLIRAPGGLPKRPSLEGKQAFHFYETYGIPKEMLIEWASAANFSFDIEEFNAAMREAQERSRAAQGAGDVFGDDEDIVVATANNAPVETRFVGYKATEHDANLVQISPRFGKDGKTTGDFQVRLDESPFYAESGGQVGDTGRIICDAFELEVSNTWREMGQIWSDCKLASVDSSLEEAGNKLAGLSREKITQVLQTGFFFRPVRAIVDAKRRRDIIRNHTATHLLHAALREVLGKHVTQAGSLVAPDRLRFDFTHGQAMAADELSRVEEIVNGRIADSEDVCVHEDVDIAQARALGAMMLFGEKYGDRVRMIEIPSFSLELCGGTHVSNTSEIGLFKITSETSSASGVRRIEAVTGRGAYEWVREREEIVRETADALRTSPAEIARAAERLQQQVRELKKANERGRAAEVSAVEVEPVQIGPFIFYSCELKAGQDEGKLLVDRLVEKEPNAVGLVAVSANGKVTFYAKAGDEAVSKGAHAGNLVREVSKIAGGGGGGSPNFAQAGAKDPSKAGEALAAAPSILQNMLR